MVTIKQIGEALALGELENAGTGPLIERLRQQWPDTPHHRDSLHRDAADAMTKAAHAAVSAIYFADSSDYLPALWSIVRALDPAMAELLERDESAAWDKSHERTSGDRPNARGNAPDTARTE